MAKYSYRGKKITGTSTTAKVFNKSGIKIAKKNQTYLNTDTGHVYICTDSGKKDVYTKTKDRTVKKKTYYKKENGKFKKVTNPKKDNLKYYYEKEVVTGSADIAKWKYLRTDVVKRPSVAVSYLAAPVRQSGNRKMKATWKTPSAMVDKKKGDRATALDISWYLGIAGKDPRKIIKTTNENATESTINLDALVIGRKTWRRSDFYPFNGKKKLSYVSVTVQSRNEKGVGAWVKKQRDFAAPRAPSISEGEFTEETGEVAFTITTNAGTDYRERYDTLYTMKVYYSSTKKTVVIVPNKNNQSADNKTGTTTATSKTIFFDDPSYASRSYDDYAKVTVTAKARGYAGDSATTTRVFYVAYPAKAEITKYKVSGKTSVDKCTLYINTHSTTEHPVDRVKLEILANSDYATASAIPADAGWEQTEIIDDANCTAMAISVSELMPDRGKFTWVRLKTYHANERVLYRYSNYVRIKDLETPEATALDDKIQILSAVPGADGASAVVDLVWDDGTPVSTGTELSWSDEEDSWKSTKDPDKYEFTWSDGPRVVDGETWPGSATITIKNLEAGGMYYVKARRYNEGDITTYSEYSNPVTVLTSERPESVVATADRYVPKGSGLNVYWTFSGNGLQTEWQIITSNLETIIASGQGATGSTQIPSNRLEELAVDGSLKYVVQVSTGSGWVSTEEKEVTLIDKPTLTLTAPATMTIQPYEFTAVASVPSDLVVIVTSQGATGQFPQGMRNQTSGDTIFSDVFMPDWIAGYVQTADTEYLDKKYYSRSGDTFTEVVPESEEGVIDPTINPAQEGWYEETEGVSATVTLPPALDFWDLGRYTLAVTAIDRQTELRSDQKTAAFGVLWANQAVSPESKVVYSLSADTAVVQDKNYYTYDSETKIYTAVEVIEGTEDPSALGWYEQTTTRYITLTAQDYVDDNGFHHQAVQIQLTPPEGSSETDVYDIYRMTGDGARLIGESFPLTYTAVDEYAPFGEDMTNNYRIALRTVDGDVAFSDFEYVLDGAGIRIDWAEGFIEYPYGVSIEDSYSKDVEIRAHMDGTINGYWNEGIRRKGSLSTDMIKIIQASDVDTTRRLARYVGAAFVRTKEGTAFEADVQITKLSERNLAVMNVAIDAEEIDLTDEFMLPIPNRLVDEEEG